MEKLPPAFTRELRVLIVEDNPVDCKMMEGMLAKFPEGRFKAVTAQNLPEAFVMLEGEKFDVVLLDLNLDESGGMETLNQLHQRFPEVPIVVNTGAYQDDLGLKAVTSGAQDYLIKGKYQPYGLCKALYYAVERKKGELELEKACQRLKETQAQLIQVEKMNIIGTIASGVAHEVKNPLATIIYGVEVLRSQLNGQLTDKASLALSSIGDAAQRANQIVRDLLDFSSFSALEKKPADINLVVNHALQLIQHQLEKQCIQVHKDMENNVPWVSVDTNRIEQALIDLFLNAVQAMRGGGELTVRTRESQITDEDQKAFDPNSLSFKKGDSVVCIEISDTGPGIKEETLPRVFDPFFTTRRHAGGVGLGLSIALTIVKNHGGGMRLFNLPHRGLCVQIILPL